MIALDVMGGDFAPDPVIAGALRAAKQSVPLVLSGPAELIKQKCSALDPGWQQYNIQIIDADQVIEMDEEPVFAVKKKQNASLVKAVGAVHSKVAQAVVSAGNSGALMVAATLLLGRQEGIARPAIGGFLPTQKGEVFVLDLGANVVCRPDYFLQFAHVGQKFLRANVAIDAPKIGLLSNGHESSKGTPVLKQAYQDLQAAYGQSFIGYIEPGDVLAHKVDMVLCDGFVGNVLLKTVEAMGAVYTGFVHESIAGEQDQQAKHTLINWQARFDKELDARLAFKRCGGALLLGVQGNVIVCHGNADAQAIERALLFAQGIVNKAS
ncbi:MAG: phosphate acyltransferase PlsX [Epsilonproteobacteria bacterium]|nr:phosphate acyltransferase PlsX [Campylobacterota bacterium]